MLTNDELQAIRERCEAATPSNLRLMDDGIVIEDDGTVIADFDSNHDDARLFIHARADIPSLLAHIEHQRRALEWLGNRMVNHYRGNMHICMEKQCHDDSGCVECLAQIAINATKEATSE